MSNTKYIMFFLLVCIFFNTKSVYASNLSFTVDPVIPENQIDKTKTYFDLKFVKNTQETIKVNIYNNSEKDLVIEPSVKTATTNLNGVVEYGDSLTGPNKSIPYKTENIVHSIEKEITIPKKSFKEVQFLIKMPSKEFKGILAGGITFQEKEKKESTKEISGMAVENKFAYVLAVVIHGNDQNISKELKLKKVSSGQVNYQNVINLSLENPQSRYINQMSINAKVTRKGHKKILYTSYKDKMQMAPDSNFNYPIYLDGKGLKSGEYIVKVKVKSQDKNWEFIKKFKISKNEANTLNEKDVTIKRDESWFYYVVFIYSLFLLMLILFYRNKSDENLS